MKNISTLLLLAIYFFTPFESIAISENISIIKIIFFLFVVFSILNFKNINFKAKSKFIHFISIYFLYCFLTFFWSIDMESTIYALISRIIPYYILVILLNWSIDSIKIINKIAFSYILGTLIVCVYAYINFKTNIGEFGYRNTAFQQDQNEFGFLINMGIVFALYMLGIYWNNKKIKILLWIFIFIFSFIVISTGSRTGFVILLLIFSVWLMRKKSKYIYQYLFIFITITIICISFIPEEIFERLLETRSQLKSGDLTSRGYIWKNAISAWEKNGNFVFGTGYNTWSNFYKSEFGLISAPHNSYLQTIIELGIVGLLLYLPIFIYLFLKAWYLSKKYNTIYLLFILPLLIVMLTLGTNERRWVFLFGILIIKLIQYQKDICLRKGG